ncbi:MAG: NAD(+) synthase [Clostridiales bacterium]|jgi:NAD+ synthase (glutamine-hydrolysing)|nr:NAD(+) synthase [Clostridiales bacterium]
MYNFIRAAAASPKIRPADLANNAAEIIRLARDAAGKGSGIVVFPELAVTGCSCGSLFNRQSFLDEVWNALETIMKETAELETLIILGLPARDNDAVHSAAVGFYKGQAVSRANLRRLSPAHSPRRLDRQIPSYFHIPVVAEVKPEPSKETAVSVSVYSGGIEPHILAVPTAEPFNAGGNERLRRRLEYQSQNPPCAVIYAGIGPCESTGEGVFGGALGIYENGRELAFSPHLSGNELLIADIDAELVMNARLSACSVEAMLMGPKAPSAIVLRDNADVLRPLPRSPFFPEDKQAWPAFCRDILDIQAQALAKRITHTAAKKAVINVSGGMDSTLALLALARAMDNLSRGRSDILGLSLPGFGTTGRTKNNASALMEALGVPYRVIDITKTCLSHFEDIGLNPEKPGLTYENAQARERTQIAMDVAGMESGIMIGTGDMSELALGFTTYNGDHMSMYNPNAGITKTAMREVIAYAAEAELFGAAASAVLRDILATPVSPELLPPSDGIPQLTEAFVGPYELHDFFLYHIAKNGFSPAKAAFLAENAFRGDYSPAEIARWLDVFVSRFTSQQYKRSCMPEGPEVLGFSLSPRTGFIIPGDCAGIY